MARFVQIEAAYDTTAVSGGTRGWVGIVMLSVVFALAYWFVMVALTMAGTGLRLTVDYLLRTGRR